MVAGARQQKAISAPALCVQEAGTVGEAGARCRLPFFPPVPQPKFSTKLNGRNKGILLRPGFFGFAPYSYRKELQWFVRVQEGPGIRQTE